MIDKRMLIIKELAEQKDLDIHQLGDILEISSRQMSRLLKTWEDQDYIVYNPGQGRGNKLKIEFIKDIEQILLFELLNNRDTLTLSEIKEYLMLPWTEHVRETLKIKLMEQYEDKNNELSDLSIVDYVYEIPKLIHPAYSKDLTSVHIMLQTFETLYTKTEEGELKYQLLRYDEWQDNALHLYLKKNVFFADGILMTSVHIKDVLTFLKEESNFQYIFRLIKSIDIIDDYHLAIDFRHPYLNIKYMLAEPFSSIYKREGQVLIGTGPYRLHQHDARQIVLKVNPFFLPVLPDIKTIYFLEKKFNARQEKIASYYKEAYNFYAGNEFILFNPKPDGLSQRQRHYIKHIILLFFDNNAAADSMYKKEWKQIEEVWTGTIPSFEKPVTMAVDELSSEHMKLVEQALTLANVPVKRIDFKHMEFIQSHLTDMDADFVWLDEYYHQSQPLKTINLLTYSKFKEWYQPLKKSKKFLNMSKNLSFHEFKNSAEKYMTDLIEEDYFIPLYEKRRLFFLPEGLKNVENQHYGTLKYHKIIIAK